MSGINVPRVLLGGLVAAAVIWVLEGVASVLYMDQMQQAMEAHGLSMDMSAKVWALSILVSYLVGVVAVFLYAGCRPRFGPGAKTAVIVGVAVWLGGYVVCIIGYHMLALFPDAMLVQWGLIGLVEMVVGTIAGAAVYRE